jgi:hypothetical protein
LPLIWDFLVAVYRLYRTDRGAGSALDALVGVDKELIRSFKAIFIACGMDAVYRANIRAGGVLYSNAWFADNVGHNNLLLAISNQLSSVSVQLTS